MKKFDTINIIPFIDILLVLLTIVLTTSTFIVQGKLELQLPEVREVNTVSNSDSFVISVDRNGDIYIGRDKTEFRVVEEKLQSLSKERHIALNVDKDASFQSFLRIIDLLKKYQLNGFSIFASRENG